MWFLLNDFSLVLATITTSLASFLKLSESDISQLDVMGEGDEQDNLQDDGLLPTEEPAMAQQGSQAPDLKRPAPKTPLAAPVKARSKPKVSESWEDDASDDDNDDDAASSHIADEGDGTGPTNKDEDVRSTADMEKGFLNIYRAFTKLKTGFDANFRKMFA